MRYTRYMAKKSSKSSRRFRAKKQEAAKKKPAIKATKAAVVITEGSDEPVVKAVQKTPSKKATAKKTVATAAEESAEPAVDATAEKAEQESAEEMLQPTRNRMLVSAITLGVIVIALIFGATIMHRQNAHGSNEMVKPGLTSDKADQILQSGGSVCANGNSQTDTTGSSNPNSVGMMLQSNPASTIQTPQTLANGADASTLQGASCF